MPRKPKKVFKADPAIKTVKVMVYKIDHEYQMFYGYINSYKIFFDHVEGRMDLGYLVNFTPECAQMVVDKLNNYQKLIFALKLIRVDMANSKYKIKDGPLEHMIKSLLSDINLEQETWDGKKSEKK